MTESPEWEMLPAVRVLASCVLLLVVIAAAPACSKKAKPAPSTDCGDDCASDDGDDGDDAGSGGVPASGGAGGMTNPAGSGGALGGGSTSAGAAGMDAGSGGETAAGGAPPMPTGPCVAEAGQGACAKTCCPTSFPDSRAADIVEELQTCACGSPTALCADACHNDCANGATTPSSPCASCLGSTDAHSCRDAATAACLGGLPCGDYERCLTTCTPPAFAICDSGVRLPTTECATCASESCCALAETCLEDAACLDCMNAVTSTGCDQNTTFAALSACVDTTCASACGKVY